jgi:hypothetical protein
LEFGRDLALPLVGAAARCFGQESAMLETPILDVVTVVVIACSSE